MVFTGQIRASTESTLALDRTSDCLALLKALNFGISNERLEDRAVTTLLPGGQTHQHIYRIADLTRWAHEYLLSTSPAQRMDILWNRLLDFHNPRQYPFHEPEAQWIESKLMQLETLRSNAFANYFGRVVYNYMQGPGGRGHEGSDIRALIKYDNALHQDLINRSIFDLYDLVSLVESLPPEHPVQLSMKKMRSLITVEELSPPEKIKILREGLVHLGIAREAELLSEQRLGRILEIFDERMDPFHDNENFNLPHSDLNYNLARKLHASVVIAWISLGAVADASRLKTYMTVASRAWLVRFFPDSDHVFDRLDLIPPSSGNVIHSPRLSSDFLGALAELDAFVDEARLSFAPLPAPEVPLLPLSSEDGDG